MRLMSLELTNFGSFIHDVIDLTEIGSATVSGLIGHGKSTAFVDALLWALFGKCRTDADSMMFLGKEHMSVTTKFALDKSFYRVFRSRSKATKAGKTELLFSVTNANGQWLPIGGHSVKETQEAIHAVLNADYELFVSTSILVQGKADRFAAASPGERKALLAQVLRLDQYADMKKLANKRIIRAEPTLSLLQKEREPLFRKIDLVLSAKERIKEAQLAIETLSSKQIITEKCAHDYRDEKVKNETKLAAFLNASQELVTLRTRQDALTSQIKLFDESILRADSLIGRREEIATKISLMKLKEEELKTIEHDINMTFESIQVLRDDMNRVEGEKLKHAEIVCDSKTGLVSIETLQKNMIEEHRQKVMGLEEQVNRDEQQIQLLGQVPCGKDLQGQCQFTINATQTLEHLPMNKHRYKEMVAKDPVKESGVDFTKEVNDRQVIITASEQVIETQDQQIIKLKKQLESLYLSEQELQKKKKQSVAVLESLMPFTKLAIQLESTTEEKANMMELRKNTQAHLNETLQSMRGKIAALEEKDRLALWLLDSESQLNVFDQEVTRVKDEMESIGVTLTDHRRYVSEAEAAQIRITQIDQELKEVALELQAAQTLHGIYDSIPIMLMEQAVPMLEVSCNSILEQISPTGMRIRLDTQKALKSRDGVAETLDIVVRDVIGERRYENYSGGERFRLDLALRFGLSQLLMNRAGSRIETLVIDEGLGSLDAEGLQLLRECLTKMEESFGLILVISHIEAIQGTFPTSITVVKGLEGSKFEVEM